jgi:pyroglutamyl-peptidase
VTRTEPTLLLTGFEPFGGELDNPAMALLPHFSQRRILGHRVETELLPVSFAGALAALDAALRRAAPRLVLGIGQAGGRARLSLERVALNLIDARIPDNDGMQPFDAAVIPGAPAAHFSTLPLKAALAALQAQGVPAELSLSAGTYVCNAVFFASCQRAQDLAAPPRVGFLHVPYLPAQAAHHPGAPSMALETMRTGIETVLQVALETPVDIATSGGTIC